MKADNRAGSFVMIAKTMHGLEDMLANELSALGAEDIAPGRRMVSFVGDKRLMYMCHLHLRTALRILVPIAQFEARNADEIYQYLYDHISWDEYLTPRTTFAFDTVVYSDAFTHSKFVAYRAKDAISDYFTDREHKRPNVSVADPDVRFHIHIADRSVTLALDASGESLHKRGYRVGQNDAPISEVLAAGILLKAGWRGQCDLLDPMCGSGTFLTEAALIALGIPPGIFRESFAFEKWKDFDSEMWDEIADEWEELPFEHHIYGSDIDPKAIALSRANIRKAGLSKHITTQICAMSDYTAEQRPAEQGLLVTNPPYGERMRPEQLSTLYNSMGSTLKHAFMGWKAWIISGNTEEGFKSIGLKHTDREILYNGMIECELRSYDLFGGKRDEHLKQLHSSSTTTEGTEDSSSIAPAPDTKVGRRDTPTAREQRPRRSSKKEQKGSRSNRSTTDRNRSPRADRASHKPRAEKYGAKQDSPTRPITAERRQRVSARRETQQPEPSESKLDLSNVRGMAKGNDIRNRMVVQPKKPFRPRPNQERLHNSTDDDRE